MNQNCYILVNKNNKGFIIDPGLDTKSIVSFLEKEKIEPKYVFLTHGHFDHIFSAKKLKDMGAKIYISEIDAPKLLDYELNMGFLFNIKPEPVLPDGFFKEGENVFDDEKFEIIFTPGHTSGSVVIIYKDIIFTGDTYFSEGVYGRTDLLDGNQEEIEKSIIKLNPIIKTKKIYSGHE